MKSLASLLITLLLPLSSALAGDTPELESYRTRVLHHRVSNVLKLRRDALERCAGRSNDANIRSFNESVDDELARAPSPASLGELLYLTQESKFWEKKGRCREELAAAEASLRNRERAKFRSKAIFLAQGSLCVVGGFGLGRGSDCAKAVAKMNAELDPHCEVDVLPNWNGGSEDLPCFAGDRLAIDSLWSNGLAREKVMDGIQEYVWGFFNAVNAARAGQTIDLASFHRQGNRELLLAMLTFFAASATSHLGYVDGFGEHVWRDGVWQMERPREILTRYHDQKRMVDVFRDIFALSQKKGLHLTLGNTGADLTTANRHDFMAGFLACHYQRAGQESISRLLPKALGYAYEGLDFVSHLKHGVPLSTSVDNFDRDTDRYINATAWGRKYCSGG